MTGQARSGPVVAAVLALSLLCAVPRAGGADGAWVPGIEQLYRIDRLAELRESTRVASVSSYDRSGGNNDGFDGQFSFVRKEKDGLVLADLSGPGVIYRISTPTPTDDLLEFYFDGEEQPRIQVPFRELFLGTHPAFPRPLVGYGAGGFYCYVPLPYEKSCKVFIRAERVQFYQLNYATYPEGHGIQSFRANLRLSCSSTSRRHSGCLLPAARTSARMSSLPDTRSSD